MKKEGSSNPSTWLNKYNKDIWSVLALRHKFYLSNIDWKELLSILHEPVERYTQKGKDLFNKIIMKK